MYFKSLQTRFLLALVLLSLLPSLISGIYVLNQQEQALRNEAKQEITGLARGLAAKLSYQVSDLLADSRVMAQLPEIVSMDPVQQQAILRQLFTHYQRHSQLSVLSLTGEQLLLGKDAPKVSTAKVPSFQIAAQQGKQAVVVAPAPTGNKLLLHFHTPIRNANGTLVGVFGSPVALTNLAEELRSLAGDMCEVFVIDSNGTIFVHSDPALTDTYPTAPDDLRRLPSSNESSSGSLTYLTDQTTQLVGYAQIPELGWTVIVQRVEADVLAPLLNARRLMLIVQALGALAVLVVAYVLARSLTWPLRRLALAAQAFGAGDATVTLPTQPEPQSELGQLVDAFSTMRQAVHEREREILKHQSAMEASIDGMMIVKDAKIVYANQALAQMHGYAQGNQLLGNPWRIFYSEQEQQRIASAMSPLAAHNGGAHDTVWRGEVRSVRRDRSEIDQEISLAQIEPGEFVAVVRDLTERKHAERTLQMAQKLESLGVLAGGIAHDFNNLLTAIMGQTSLAASKLPADSPATKHIDRAVQSAQRAAELTRQLLAYARKGKVFTEVLDLNALIVDNTAILEVALPKHIPLRLDLTASPLAVEVDRAQIQQVVMNLVINAFESITQENGEVAVRTATHEFKPASLPRSLQDSMSFQQFIGNGTPQAGRYAMFEVSDTGCGMDAATVERIFDPFFSTKTDGSGLGLAAALGIIQSHRGYIQVQSQLERGSTFRIFLPLSQEIPPPTIATQQPQTKIRGAVLVVDDEESVRELAQEALASVGIETLLAKNGTDGVEMYSTHCNQIDVVLLDMRMPGISGEQALQQIQQLNADAKVLLSSGYAEPEANGSLNGKNKVQFLQKPYTATMLVTKIQSLLAK